MNQHGVFGNYMIFSISRQQEKFGLVAKSEFGNYGRLYS